MLDHRGPTKLILISGSPGSGKTTLSREIAQHFGFPVISCDALKEQLFGTMPLDDRASSRQLGVTSWSLLYAVIDTLIEHVPDVIVDSNFSHGVAEPEVLPRLAKCSSAVVHYCASWHAIENRIKAPMPSVAGSTSTALLNRHRDSIKTGSISCSPLSAPAPGR